MLCLSGFELFSLGALDLSNVMSARLINDKPTHQNSNTVLIKKGIQAKELIYFPV